MKKLLTLMAQFVVKRKLMYQNIQYYQNLLNYYHYYYYYCYFKDLKFKQIEFQKIFMIQKTKNRELKISYMIRKEP